MFLAVVAILLGDVYEECTDILQAEVEQLASIVNLIFQTSGKLSLLPASLAATLRLPAWKNFVKAADDGLYLGNVQLDLIPILSRFIHNILRYK